MILKKGDFENLTGNVVFYWKVSCEKGVAKKDFKILAVNLMISVLNYESKLLTTTFPPVPCESFQSLFASLKDMCCDIVYVGEFRLHANKKKQENVYQKEFENYNQLVEEYVMLLKDKRKFRIFDLTEREKLILIRNFTKEFLKSNQEAGNEKDVLFYRILRLTKVLRNEERYDVSLFLNALEEKNKVRAWLYISKFLAVHDEDYETAGNLQKELTKLQSGDNVSC